jgi:hypothetical protein
MYCIVQVSSIIGKNRITYILVLVYKLLINHATDSIWSHISIWSHTSIWSITLSSSCLYIYSVFHTCLVILAITQWLSFSIHFLYVESMMWWCRKIVGASYDNFQCLFNFSDICIGCAFGWLCTYETICKEIKCYVLFLKYLCMHSFIYVAGWPTVYSWYTVYSIHTFICPRTHARNPSHTHNIKYIYKENYIIILRKLY